MFGFGYDLDQTKFDKKREDLLSLPQLQLQLNLIEVGFEMNMSFHKHLPAHNETHCLVVVFNLSLDKQQQQRLC